MYFIWIILCKSLLTVDSLSVAAPNKGGGEEGGGRD